MATRPSNKGAYNRIVLFRSQVWSACCRNLRDVTWKTLHNPSLISYIIYVYIYIYTYDSRHWEMELPRAVHVTSHCCRGMNSFMSLAQCSESLVYEIRLEAKSQKGCLLIWGSRIPQVHTYHEIATQKTDAQRESSVLAEFHIVLLDHQVCHRQHHWGGTNCMRINVHDKMLSNEMMPLGTLDGDERMVLQKFQWSISKNE